MHWQIVQEKGGAGSIALDAATPLNAAIPTSLKLTVETAAGGQQVGVFETSTATYKFVFSHNLVGGVDPNDLGPMRGGVEAAKFLEWGGYNLDGTYGFDTYRPELPMPIHQVLVANHVTAFFRGHDHLYGHQTLDGIAYQEVPQPSAVNTNLGTRGADYGYTQGTLLGGRGYLHVTVAPTGVTVQYVETWLPSEQRANQTNRMVADSYTLAAVTAAQPPVISSVGNAAGGSAIAPNSWVEIKGSNLSAATAPRVWQASDFIGGQMPTQLDGVSATINGKPAYVYYISPTQVNVLAPPDPMDGPVTVQVSVNGTASAAFTATAQTLAASFFTFDGAGHVAATHADGSLLGPTALYPGSSTPARPGETVVIYGNGFGATTTPVTAGSSQQSGALSPPPAFTIGGEAAQVQFAGLVFPGEYQFNVVVPNNTPSGDQLIVATLGGRTTQAGAVLSVQAPGNRWRRHVFAYQCSRCERRNHVGRLHLRWNRLHRSACMVQRSGGYEGVCAVNDHAARRWDDKMELGALSNSAERNQFGQRQLSGRQARRG